MNEASSKFVDNLALERLLNEKVSKVSHSPNHSLFEPEENLFGQLGKTSLDFSAVRKKEGAGTRWFEIPSFETSSCGARAPYPENDWVSLYQYPANAPEGNILFLHGLFDDNMFNYAYLTRLLNDLNLNLFYMTLPYHFQRKPAASLFSGEYFFSADIYRTQNAIKQAVYDVEACLQFIGRQNPFPTVLVGFSMGGSVSFRYYQLKNQSVATFLLNPVTDLSMVIWDNPLLVSVGRDLRKNGYNPERCAAIFKELDPCENLPPNLNLHNIATVYSIFDQIIEETKSNRFVERTGIQNVHRYHAGHLNILRVPKLATDIRQFFEKVYMQKKSGEVKS